MKRVLIKLHSHPISLAFYWGILISLQNHFFGFVLFVCFVRTCHAPAELFFSCADQLFVDVRSIVKPGSRLTRLEIPNARAKPATGQWVTHCSFVLFLWSLQAGRHSRSQVTFDSAYHAQNIRVSRINTEQFLTKQWQMIFLVQAHSVSIMLGSWKNNICPNQFFSFFIKNKSFWETAPKSLFLAPSYVPGFDYAPWLAF